MAFRNPVYLDLETLENLADNFGIVVPGEAQIVQRTAGDGSGAIGLQAGVVKADYSRNRETEVTESYSRAGARPVRLFNDVLDSLQRNEDVRPLDAVTSYSRRDLVEFDGLLSVSPVTEIGSLIASLMPAIRGALEETGAENMGGLNTNSLIGTLLGDTPKAITGPVIIDVQTVDALPRLIIIAEGQHLFRSSGLDDLGGDRSVFAIIDRIVSDADSFSLAKYLMPGINPLMRAGMATGGPEGLLESLEPMLGKKVDPAVVQLEGPALVLTPIAIY